MSGGGNGRGGLDGAKSYIGISSDPFSRVNSHNRVKGFIPGAKSTRQNFQWHLDLIVGPFTKGLLPFSCVCVCVCACKQLNPCVFCSRSQTLP